MIYSQVYKYLDIDKGTVILVCLPQLKLNDEFKQTVDFQL